MITCALIVGLCVGWSAGVYAGYLAGKEFALLPTIRALRNRLVSERPQWWEVERWFLKYLEGIPDQD
jgi:hypothetical protein